MQNQNQINGLTFDQKLAICNAMPAGYLGDQTEADKVECFKNISALQCMPTQPQITIFMDSFALIFGGALLFCLVWFLIRWICED